LRTHQFLAFCRQNFGFQKCAAQQVLRLTRKKNRGCTASVVPNFAEKNSPTKVGGQFLRHQLRTEVRSVNGLFFHRTCRVDGVCDPRVSWQESAVKVLDAFRVEKGFADAVRGFDGDANDAEMR
jgi:hypothetical protein